MRSRIARCRSFSIRRLPLRFAYLSVNQNFKFPPRFLSYEFPFFFVVKRWICCCPQSNFRMPPFYCPFFPLAIPGESFPASSGHSFQFNRRRARSIPPPFRQASGSPATSPAEATLQRHSYPLFDQSLSFFRRFLRRRHGPRNVFFHRFFLLMRPPALGGVLWIGNEYWLFACRTRWARGSLLPPPPDAPPFLGCLTTRW